MNKSKSIISIKEYDKINIELERVLKERGIKRGTLAKAINTRFEVIDKWCKNRVEKLDLDILARICYALECEPSDLIKCNANKEEDSCE